MKTRRSKANRRRSITRVKGGVYQRQGTYGCVFNPAIKCSDEAARRPGTISKLMIAEEADEEFSQHYALKGIDPQQKYLLWPLRLCEPEYADPENNSRRCTVAGAGQDIRAIQPKVVLYKDGGLALDQVVITSINIIPILTGLRNLFRGLAVLHAADMAHLDIKLGNIVALQEPATNTYNIRFIDFGLTCDATKFEPRELDPTQQEELQRIRDELEENLQEGRDIIKGIRVSLASASTEAAKHELKDLLQERERQFETVKQAELLKIANKEKRMAYDHVRVYTSDYSCWPFELRFVHPYYKRVDLMDEIIEWYDPEYFSRDSDTVPTWTWYNDRGDAILNTDAGRDILARAAAAPVKNIIQAADIYALGRVISMMYAKCIGHIWMSPGYVYGARGKGTDALKDPVSRPLYTLVQRMMSPDMFARPTALEAADEYERVVAALLALYGLPVPIPDSMNYNAVGPVEGAHPVSPLPPLPASPAIIYTSPANGPKIGRRLANTVQSPRVAITPPKRRFADPGFMVPRTIGVRRLPPLGLESPKKLSRPLGFGSPSAKYSQQVFAAPTAPAASAAPANLGLFSPGARRFTLKGPNKNFHSPGVASASEPAGRSAPAVSGPAPSDPRATSRA